MVSFELRVILIYLTAYFSTLFILPKIANIALRIGLVDEPNNRKVHKMPRPLVGGIGIVISATFSNLLFISIEGLRGFFLGLALLLLVGFLDDYREINLKQKFLAQIAATALLIYFSKVCLRSFGDLFGLGDIDISGNDLLVWSVTVFCVVGVINAINMMDGLDGLAGGVSFLAFLAFAIHSALIGNKQLMLLNLSLAGAVLGFLKFNWSPSTLFMGDAGSLCLGFSLSFMALALTQGSGDKISPVVPLLVLAVPITDTIVVMVRRVFRGGSPFKADQIHLHHILLRFGIGRVETVKFILLLCILLCLLSFLGHVRGFSDRSLFLIYLVYVTLFLAACGYIAWAFPRGKQLREGEQLLDWLPAARMVRKLSRLFYTVRREKRYPVQLAIVCRSVDGGREFQGTVLNMSRDGFMASINDLDVVYERMQVKISFPPDPVERSIELSAEHLWLQQRNDRVYHGFRFDGEGEQRDQATSIIQEFTNRPAGQVVDRPIQDE
ncbi:MAG: hypothetical protein F9K32_10330 [Desulfobulbaceae bacterium]|nr:MAG: hypothetical protein F9K32_10330 [Desulfobulbaceae bacterium]